MEYYTGKGRNGQDKKKKTCRETQHVKIDMERDASIIICRMVAVGENYNSTRDKILDPGDYKIPYGDGRVFAGGRSSCSKA